MSYTRLRFYIYKTQNQHFGTGKLHDIIIIANRRQSYRHGCFKTFLNTRFKKIGFFENTFHSQVW